MPLPGSGPVPGGGYGPPRTGKTLPFGLSKPHDKQIVVVFQIQCEDPAVTQTVSTKIAEAVKAIHLGDYGIQPVLSTEKVTMSTTDTERLAQALLPTILRLLQIPGYERT